MGRASIAANLVTSGFSEHPMGPASIATHLVTSGFLEASDGASIHRCQPGMSGFSEHPMGPASIATHLVTSGFLEASDGASLHRCHKHVVSTSKNASCANEFEPFSGCSHLLILILHSLSSSEMSPLIAAHVFSWAWRYNLGITSADVFARDLTGIL